MVKYLHSFAFKIQALNIFLLTVMSIVLISIFLKNFEEINYKNLEGLAETTVKYLNADIQVELEKAIDLVIFGTENVGRTTKEADREFLVRMLPTVPYAFEYYYGTTLSRFDGGSFTTATDWEPYKEPEWDQLKRPWFKFAMQNPDKPNITDPYIDWNTKLLCVSVVKTVKDTSNTYKGVVGLDIFLTDLTNMVNSRKVTPDGSTYLIKRNGSYITHTDQKYILERSIFEDLDTAEFSREKVLNDRASVLFGKKSYVVSMPVANTNWFLISTGSLANLDRSRMSSIYAAIAITIVLSLVISIILSNLISRRIQYIMTTLNKISDGNLGIRIDESHHDEISDMSKHFNGFIDKLREFMKFVGDYASILTKSSDGLDLISDEFSKSIQKMRTAVDNSEDLDSAEKELERNVNTLKDASMDLRAMAHGVKSILKKFRM